jgi:spore germination protein GerM
MKKLCFAVLMTAFLLTACAQKQTEPEGILLYYITDSSATYGSAIATQAWEGTGTPLNEELMQDLLEGPTQEGLVSPFPKGVTIQSLEFEGTTMCLTLSEHYSGLTDISRTLADACIVMTACQFPQISQVEISSDGFWSSRPASRTLSPEQLDLETLLP